MASNIYIDADDQFDGTCELLIQDLVTGIFTRFGRIKKIDFSLEWQKITNTKVVRGFIQKVNERAKSGTAKLSFELWELSKLAAQLMLHEYTQAQTFTAATQRPRMVAKRFRQELKGTGQYPPLEDVAWGTDTNLAPITSVGAAVETAPGTGAVGGWTTASYTMYVLPVYLNYGNTQANIACGAAAATFASRVDLPEYYTFGVISSGIAFTPSATQAAEAFTLTQAVIGKDDVLPDGWAVFVGLTSGGIAAALFDMYVANSVTAAGGTQVLTLTAKANAGNEAYSAAKRACFRSEAGYVVAGGSSVTYTKLTIGTDVTWDATVGMFNRIAAGALSDMQMCDISIWTLESQGVTFDVGRNVRNTDYRQAQIYAVEADPNPASGETLLGRGWTMNLEKVNFAGLPFKIMGDEENFLPGTQCDCECLSSSNNRYGTWTHRARSNADYVQSFS